MTWKYLLLMVFLNTFDLLTAGCGDYFFIDTWPSIHITMDNLTQTIAVVKAPTLYDTIKCTLEKEKTKRDVDFFLRDCFTEDKVSCGSDSFGEVHFYHFMCLMAQALEITLEGCDCDTMWRISSSFGQTTTTTTELPTTTKTLETTVTLSSSASSSMVSSSTLPPTTSTTSAVSQTALTQSNEHGQVDKQADGTRATDVTMTTFVFILSIVVVALVMCILYKHLQHRRRGHTDMERAADDRMNPPAGVPAQAQPQSADADADADADAEQRSRLMQDPVLGPGSVDTSTEEKHLRNGRMH